MRKLFSILMALMAFTCSIAAQNRTYHGIVVDADTKEPLIGVSILPLGGGVGTATDVDGKFTLTVPASVKQIKVTYVGMTPVTVNLADNMTVELKSETESLDDLVVMGYGSAKKAGSIVGSVSVVGSAQLENIPTATFIDALQGQVPGLNINSNSGDPSATQSVRIRGVNSLNAGITPLYVLDGAPIDETLFTNLNPNDIQNITILKDASAVAIYGSRAANGVIVITSKKGNLGEKPKVTLRANVGWSQMVEDGITMMNSDQYVHFRDLIGRPAPAGAVEAATKFGINTDWRKEMFNSSAPTYSLDGTVSGGGEKSQYYFSVNHYDQKGIITASGLRRETIRASIFSNATDWLRLGLQTNLGYTKWESNSQISSDGIYLSNPMVFARAAMPYDSPRYYTIGSDGMPVYGDKAMWMHYTGTYNPYFITSFRDQNRTKVNANIVLSEQISPIPGLILKAQQALDAYDYRSDNVSLPYETIRTPMGDQLGQQPVGEVNTGWNSQGFERYVNFTYTNTAEYNFQIKDVNNFTILLGQESIITRDRSFGVGAEGLTDRKLTLLTNATTVSLANLSQSKVNTTFNSYFIKATYDYANRYFIEGTFRRDGSSKFTPRHRYANFFSTGAMWNAKNEKFLEDVDWLNEFQLRVSYGSTGNSSIEDYLYYGAVGEGSIYGPNNSASLGVSNPKNYDLTWETVYSFDVGTHFKIFDRATAEIDFYKKTTKNMLMGIPWSYTTGFSGGWSNVGSMTNTGVDVNASVDLIRNRDFYWGVRANFNYNKNKITELFNGRDRYVLEGYGYCYQIGHDAGEFYGVPYLGVDPLDGKQVWLDINDNPTKVFNEEADGRLLGKSYFAPWNGGFGTSLSWKGFGLSADFNWSAEKYMMNNDLYFLQNAALGNSWNQSVEMLNVWTKPGDVTKYPNASETIQFDSRQLEDASYLRMKTLTLTYRLPQAALNAIRLDNVVFHFTGRNLFTVTKFTGYDPEPQVNVYQFLYPNTRQFEFGVEVTI
ncbi:MAG: TonB-dependent receptor [Muribaculaceae bacterium]|nr:TonB-dependent receptor [Muribaculaceae bacterium]MDE6796248.1 TonB-dependent receptor [Muribaculaceae bacterium]